MGMSQPVTLAPASSTTVTLTSTTPLPASVAGDTLVVYVSLSNGRHTATQVQVASPTVATPQDVGVNVVATLTAGEPGTADVALYNMMSSPVVVNTVTVAIFPSAGATQPLSSGSAGPVTLLSHQSRTVTVRLPTLPTSYYGQAYASVSIDGGFAVNIGVTISPPTSTSAAPTSTVPTMSSPTSQSATQTVPTTASTTAPSTSTSSSQCSPLWWNGLMSTLDEAMSAAQAAKKAYPACGIAIWVATPPWATGPLYAITFSTASQPPETVFGQGVQASLYTVV